MKQVKITAKQLNKLLNDKNLTRAELAILCGLSINAVNSWFVNPQSAMHRNPSGPALIILENLGLEVEK